MRPTEDGRVGGVAGNDVPPSAAERSGRRGCTEDERPDRAVLLVHGIGIQAPYQVRDSFVRHLQDLQDPRLKLICPDVPVSSELGEPLPPRPSRVELEGQGADIYEVYWAPHTSRQTTARSVLAWLLRLTFVPTTKMRWGSWKNWYDFLLMIALLSLIAFVMVGGLVTLANLTDRAACGRTQISVLTPEQIREVCPGSEGDLKVAAPSRQDLFSANFREVGAMAAVLWESVPKTPAQFFSRTTSDLTSSRAIEVLRTLNLWEVFLLIAIAWVLAQVLYRFWELVRVGRPSSRVMQGLVGLAAMAGGVAFSALPLGPVWVLIGAGASTAAGSWWLRVARSNSRLGRMAQTGRSWLPKAVLGLRASILFLGFALIGVMSRGVDPAFVALAFVLATMLAVLRAARTFLAESIGDIQVYMSRDPNSPHFKAREEVLAELETVFKAVSANQYKEVVIVAHSLGAVVCFDGLLRLYIRGSPLLQRIRSILTIGAAVEKVRYFFSQEQQIERVQRDTATGHGTFGVREDAEPGQNTSESSRGRLKDLDEAIGLVAPGAETEVGYKEWINLWYWNDAVADPITMDSESPGEIKDLHLLRDGESLLGREGRLLRHLRREAGNVDSPTVSAVIDEAHKTLVTNISLGWRWIWPHSHYQRDPRVLSIIKDVAFRELPGAATESPVRKGRLASSEAS